MKRLAALVVGIGMMLGLGACGSTDNTFSIENGVCYRTRTEHRVGIQVHKDKVLAVPEDCNGTETTP